MSEFIHRSVMTEEVLHWLQPSPGKILVDATLGAGGHAALLAERVQPGGYILACEQDPVMLDRSRPRLEGLPVHSVRCNFDQLRALLNDQGIERVDGLIADLGFASDQMEDSSRGLSFQRDGPLDMRLDPEGSETAADLANQLDERSLANLFWEFGEERFSRRVARRIVESRVQNPVQTTLQLAELVRSCVPRGSQRIDPATRVFQALRIAVNDELGALERLLADLPRCLKPGGRVVIISFHSLEDRLVKRVFQDRKFWHRLTKKPIVASDEEQNRNPRSRSAKLRAAERTMEG